MKREESRCLQLFQPPPPHPPPSPPSPPPARIEDMRRSIGVGPAAGGPDELQLTEQIGEGTFGKVGGGGSAFRLSRHSISSFFRLNF
jgi:hypothetical protein